jgi:hypothetical protein
VENLTSPAAITMSWRTMPDNVFISLLEFYFLGTFNLANRTSGISVHFLDYYSVQSSIFFYFAISSSLSYTVA